MTNITHHFLLVWQAGARPPVFPEPMIGKRVFLTLEDTMIFVSNCPDDFQFISLTQISSVETVLFKYPS